MALRFLNLVFLLIYNFNGPPQLWDFLQRVGTNKVFCWRVETFLSNRNTNRPRTPLIIILLFSKQNLHGENAIVSNINAVRQELIIHFNNTLVLIQELLPNTVASRNSTRSKKALFGILGSLAYSLFGVSTDNQLKQITNQMNILRKAISGMNNVMAQNNKEFASYVKTVDNRISKGATDWWISGHGK